MRCATQQREDCAHESSPKVYISGKLFDKSDAKISVFDHGLLYGDGVFEGIRAYSGRVFRLKQHVDRLYESAQGIHLQIPMKREEMAAAIVDTLAFNKLSDAYIRVIVTQGAGSLGLDPRKTTDPQVIIITDHISLYPEELYEHGLKIITAATTRNHPNAVNPRIKSLNYLNNILAKIEGTNAGCLEALMLNHKGEVAECTGDNIFVVHGGKIHTPSIDSGILEGITRDAVIELARAAGHTVIERTMDRHDVFNADECFLTGTAAELIPVVECDGRVIGTGRPDRSPASSASGFRHWSVKSDERKGRRDRDQDHPGPDRFQCALRTGRPLCLPAGGAARFRAASAARPLRDPAGGPRPALDAGHAGPVLQGKRRPGPGNARSIRSTRPGESPRPSSRPSGGAARSSRSFRTPTITDRLDHHRDSRTDRLSHVLLGSVAERIVREAPCPVLTIRDRKAQIGLDEHEPILLAA